VLHDTSAYDFIYYILYILIRTALLLAEAPAMTYLTRTLAVVLANACVAPLAREIDEYAAAVLAR
jgi:hypothetical protein